MKMNIWDFCFTRERLIVTCLSIVSHAAVFVSSPNAPSQAFEPWRGALRDKAKTASWRGRLAYQGQGYISVFPKDAITFSCFQTLKSLSLLTFLTNKTVIYCVTVVSRSGNFRSWKFRHRTCAQANENKFTDLYFSNKTMKFYSPKCLVNVKLILGESFNPWEVCRFSEICRSLTGRGFVYFNWGVLRSVLNNTSMLLLKDRPSFLRVTRAFELLSLKRKIRDCSQSGFISITQDTTRY